MASLSTLQERVDARKRKLLRENFSDSTVKRWRRKGDLEKEAAQAYLAKQALKEKSFDKSKRVPQSAQTTPIACNEKESETLDLSREKKEVLEEQCLEKIPGTNSETNDVLVDRVDTDFTESLSVDSASRGICSKTLEPPLNVEEVLKRLRSLHEPATLFGETAWDRFRRLRDRELAREVEGRGQKNIFQSKMRQMQREDAVRSAYEYSNAVIVRRPSQNQAVDVLLKKSQKNDFSCSEEYVQHEIERFVDLWQQDVDSMAPERRQTNKGRTAAVTLEQTKEWLKPLLRRLRRRKLPCNILRALTNIFEAVAEREYVQANSFYYEQLAIGNAPWPMGATMVGIHARAAREKIGEDKIAHVMNDEESRKYIQGIKRLVTLAQTHYPTVPSKMISS